MKDAKPSQDEKAILVFYDILAKIAKEVSSAEQERVYSGKRDELEKRLGIKADEVDYNKDFFNMEDLK